MTEVVGFLIMLQQKKKKNTKKNKKPPHLSSGDHNIFFLLAIWIMDIALLSFSKRYYYCNIHVFGEKMKESSYVSCKKGNLGNLGTLGLD